MGVHFKVPSVAVRAFCRRNAPRKEGTLSVNATAPVEQIVVNGDGKGDQPGGHPSAGSSARWLVLSERLLGVRPSTVCRCVTGDAC